MSVVILGLMLGVNFSLWAEPMEYDTPIAAADSLLSAFRESDSKQLKIILGEELSKLMPLLQPEKANRDYNFRRFIEAYDEHHIIERTGSEAILCVGKTQWPFFIPIVSNSSDKWAFDIEKGVKELKVRKIGENEIFVMNSLNAYVDGQREFFENNYSKASISAYAQKFFSDKDSYNGLYWRKTKGKPESPLGPYIAWAEQSGRKGARNKPYSGYYYKIITKQGVAAEGGEYSYIINDKMIFGFALIAWPADYGRSGIMSFIINHHDRIYEKDLGEETGQLVDDIDSFNPDDTWIQVDHTTD